MSIAHPAAVFGEGPQVKAEPQSWFKRTFGRKALSSDGLQVVQLPPTWPTLGGWPSSYSSFYRSQTGLRNVVDFLAKNLGQLNPKVYRRSDDNSREEERDHPLATILQHPNDNTTRFEMLRDTISDLALFGNAFWLKFRVGEQLKIVRVSPTQIVLEYDNTTRRFKYRTSTGTTFPPERLVHFRSYNPEDPFVGLSPVETLRNLLLEEYAASANRRAFWRHGSRLGGVIERPMDAPDWSDEARQRFREDWERLTAGDGNAGKTAVLEEGSKFKQITLTPQAAQFLESRKLTSIEVANAFHVPLEMVGLEKIATNSAANTWMYQNTFGPWLKMLEQRIELQLMPEFRDTDGLYVEFNIEEKLKGSFEQQAEIASTIVGGPTITTNEWRIRANLPPMGDLDDPENPYNNILTPLNSVRGGGPQPSPQQPLEDGGDREDAKTREEYARLHEKTFRKFFDHQRRVVMTEAGLMKQMGSEDIRDIWDEARWDRELTADLTVAGLSVSDDSNYVHESAQSAAEQINTETRQHLVAAGADSEALDRVFEAAIGARATELGLTRADELIAQDRSA